MGTFEIARDSVSTYRGRAFLAEYRKSFLHVFLCLLTGVGNTRQEAITEMKIADKHGCCVALLIVCCVPSILANAQAGRNNIADSGNRYVEICSSIEKPTAQWNEMDFLNAGVCQGYMMGFRDGIAVSTAVVQHDNPSTASLKGSVEDFGICIPDEVELGQMIRVVLKYIREHPEEAHLPSSNLVFMAELEAFHCTKSPQK
jgi:Rap1a immunity proteins